MENGQLKITPLFAQTWHAVAGSKIAIISVSAIILVLAIGTRWLFFSLLPINAQHPPLLTAFVIMPIVINCIIAPLYASAVMLAIRHLRHQVLSLNTVTYCFKSFGSIVIAWLIIDIIASLPLLIINLPNLLHYPLPVKTSIDLLAGFFACAIYGYFLLSVPLIIDQRYSAIKALITSIRILKQHWRKLILLMLIGYALFLLISAPPALGAYFNNATIAFIGVIFTLFAFLWLIPLLFLLQAKVYLTLTDNL